MKNSEYLIHSFAPSDFNEGNYNGLTKLEYFAGLAMQGLLTSNACIIPTLWPPDALAEASVEYGKALLAELEKPE